jgi:hypothetical protein
MRAAVLVLVLAACGGGADAPPPTSKPAEGASVPNGLDWLPADFSAMTRHRRDAFGFQGTSTLLMGELVTQIGELPPCALPLWKHIDTLYSFTRVDDDQLVTVFEGPLTRAELETCAREIGTVTTEGARSKLVLRGVEIWIGDAGGRVYASSRAALEWAMASTNRVAPGSRVATLLGELSDRYMTTVTAQDLGQMTLGVPSLGGAAETREGTVHYRVFFASEDLARQALAAELEAHTSPTRHPRVDGAQLVIEIDQ